MLIVLGFLVSGGLVWIGPRLVLGPSLWKTSIGTVKIPNRGTLCVGRSHDGDISYEYSVRVRGADGKLAQWRHLARSLNRVEDSEAALSSDSRYAAVSFDSAEGGVVVIYDSVSEESSIREKTCPNEKENHGCTRMDTDKMVEGILCWTFREIKKAPDKAGMLIPVFSSVFIRVHPWFEFFSSRVQDKWKAAAKNLEAIRASDSHGNDENGFRITGDGMFGFFYCNWSGGSARF